MPANKTFRRLRITGVVKIMNQVRALWNAGIEPARAADFKRLVNHTTQGVEEICRVHRLKTGQLPAPTFRAYQYLKSLDLDEIPKPGLAPARIAQAPDTGRLRIRNLVSFTKTLHKELFDYAQSIASQSQPPPSLEETRAGILAGIRKWTDAIEKICQDQNLSPLELPAPSRRSYLWLMFLADSHNLERHLLALITACKMIQKLDPRLVALLKRRSLTVRIEFTSLPAIYKTRLEENIYRISANEGLISAPPEVILALLHAALRSFDSSLIDPAHALGIINGYAQSYDFRSIASTFERGQVPSHLPASKDLSPTVMNDSHLEPIFHKVNQEYFGGQLSRPHLAWNKTITHRKLGQYNETTDTVLISLTLDNPHVPDYAVEFVMYHELLHKKLGIQVKNGRRSAHTRAFREEERKFRYYEQATAFLNNLGPGLNL